VRDLDALLGVLHGVLVAVELGEKRTDLHVHFAFILKFLEFLIRVLVKTGN